MISPGCHYIPEADWGGKAIVEYHLPDEESNLVSEISHRASLYINLRIDHGHPIRFLIDCSTVIAMTQLRQ